VLIDQHGQVRIIGFGVEAALAGLPPGRVSVDEVDLAGLLYCALTGKWAGVSRSAVPPAPEVHGTILRPRRVRAGIPRPLDHLCDQVLNPQATPAGEPVHHSARAIADRLLGFVGDHTGTQVPVQGLRPPATQPILPTTEAPDAASPHEPVASGTAETPVEAPVEPVGHPVTDPDATVVAPPATPVSPVSPVAPASPQAPAEPTSSTDLPTEAGMPVFHEDDEVDWLRARSDKPAPPPPLADPTPKPLFAPDPPEGEPVRRPRAGSRAAAAGKDYWPWDASQDSGVRPVSRDTGSWSSGSWNEDRWGTGEGLDDTGDQVPGRSWFRLAMIVAGCLLVLVAAVAAYQLGLTPPTPGSDDEPTTSASPSAATTPTPFTELVADDFDPQGSEPREENPDQVANVVDGDPTTTWSTSSYLQNFGPAGLKTGVGVVIDLGAAKGVRQVVVTTEGGPTSLAAYVTSTAPTGISGLTPVGTASGTGELTIDLDEAVSGRYVTVWLTLLPEVDGEFRGTVAEVQVLG
jgi:hypothetical protein